jgi:hypothetical protein
MRIRATLQALATTALIACAGMAQAARDQIPPPPPLPPEGAPAARPAPPPPPPVKASGPCANCGAIRSIREVTREKKMTRDLPGYAGSQQYLDTRAYSPPVVGPVVGMTFGPGAESKSYVGAMGSPEMRARMLEIVYEVMVGFDDGRFGIYELSDRGAFRVNDRVRAVGFSLEPLPR